MTVAKIQMWGNSRAVRIPDGLAEELSLEPGAKVELSIHGKRLVIRRISRRRRYNLSELLAHCKGENPSAEMISARVGRELF